LSGKLQELQADPTVGSIIAVTHSPPHEVFRFEHVGEENKQKLAAEGKTSTEDRELDPPNVALCVNGRMRELFLDRIGVGSGVEVEVGVEVASPDTNPKKVSQKEAFSKLCCWIFGHVHQPFDVVYEGDNCDFLRVVANPRGRPEDLDNEVYRALKL
jgi:hypothetical protein